MDETTLFTKPVPEALALNIWGIILNQQALDGFLMQRSKEEERQNDRI
jgi:hypothetical protein